MKLVVIGNILAFLGSIIMIAIGLIKEKRHILSAQCVQFGLMGAGNLVLGGYAGVVANAVSIARNLLCLFLPFTLPWKIAFIVIQGVCTFVFAAEGLLGWLPFIAACALTLSLSTKDERVLKCVLIFGQICWVVYDLSIRNYTGFVFDLLTVISNVVGIWMLTRSKSEDDASVKK